jgi:hypothetical protein
LCSIAPGNFSAPGRSADPMSRALQKFLGGQWGEIRDDVVSHPVELPIRQVSRPPAGYRQEEMARRNGIDDDRGSSWHLPTTSTLPRADRWLRRLGGSSSATSPRAQPRRLGAAPT